MFRIIHKFEMRDGIPQIVLYIYTPLEYEFADGLGNRKYNTKFTIDNIKEYVKRNLSDYPNTKLLIIVDGVIVGNMFCDKLL